MRSIIKGALSGLGLAPAGRVDRLTNELRDRDRRITALEERVAKARADSEDWKRKADASAREAAELKKGVERARSDAQRATTGLDESKARAEMLGAELKAIRARIDEATRTTSGARTQLMAIEVKLDLIEAAILVLDTRTRESAVTQAPDPVRT